MLYFIICIFPEICILHLQNISNLCRQNSSFVEEQSSLRLTLHAWLISLVRRKDLHIRYVREIRTWYFLGNGWGCLIKLHNAPELRSSVHSVCNGSCFTLLQKGWMDFPLKNNNYLCNHRKIFIINTLSGARFRKMPLQVRPFLEIASASALSICRH